MRKVHLIVILAAMAGVLAACRSGEATPFVPPLSTPGTPPPLTGAPLPAPGTPPVTPTPTPLPAARIASGDYALFLGDWEAAEQEFRLALESGTGDETAAAALIGLGRVQFRQAAFPTALDTFRQVLDQYPDSGSAPAAHFFLAQVLFELQRYDEAAQHYAQYLSLRPGLIDAYVQEWRGDALTAAGSYDQAIQAYTAALDAPRPGPHEPLEIKIGQTLSLQGDYPAALALYDDLYARTANDFLRAQINLLRGEILLLQGDPATAYAYYQDSVQNYPLAYHTYLALIQLVEAGVAVDERQRGMVDYYAGQYALAIAAFDRYLINVADAPHDGSAHYFKALALRQLGETTLAAEEFRELIDTHASTDAYWDDAWEQLGYTQWAFLGDYPAAIDTFLGFVARLPDHPRAAEFLFFAAQVAERDGQLERAARLWQRIPTEYPTHALTYRAQFLAGITLYRLGEPGLAQAALQRALEIAATPQDKAAAALWIGKTEAALGFPEAAAVTWQRAASFDPTGYYSQRALDLIEGRQPFSPPQVVDFVIDWQAERARAEAWMRSRFALPEGVDLSTVGDLAADPRFARGSELWRLGEYELARLEFEDLRQSIQNDPAANYQLANYLLDLGLYRTAIFAARQVLNLAGMDDAGTLGAPAWFNHVRFGLYYRELVLPLAEEYGLHPLLIWSLMRQESLFEGFVRSPAGARGLMQIIPSTGDHIFNNLGWPPGYTAEDLYRPAVNLPFGVDYLDEQLARFRDDASAPLGDASPTGLPVYAALAAYNGGPGNAEVWLSLAQGDPDLFLEIVRFEETRNYIRRVYEIFAIYRRIYDRTP